MGNLIERLKDYRPETGEDRVNLFLAIVGSILIFIMVWAFSGNPFLGIFAVVIAVGSSVIVARIVNKKFQSPTPKNDKNKSQQD